MQMILRPWSKRDSLNRGKGDNDLSSTNARKETMSGSFKRSDRMREKVREWCQALNISSPVSSFQQNNILVDDVRKILYCSVPKVKT
ncbi:hypothetical protein SK128_019851 [Halocaridina rubra]|uniref:Uncharacterized protein n=1 Tax=Halocaridina rubra TaxID=373956 RepID=A0AAN8X877_HALRR